MQYTINHGEKGKVEINVDVPKSAFVEAYDKVLKTLGNEAKISGFRPGHIPKDVIEQQLGSGKILNETASFLISKHLADILKKENLTSISQPSIAVGTLAKDSPFTFTATLTVKPQVTIGNWKNIKIKKVKAKEVSDKDVNESIKNIYEAWIKKSKVESQKSEVGEEAEESEESAGGQPSFAKTSGGQGKFIYDAQGEKIFIKDKKDPKDSEDIKSPSDEFAKKIGTRDLAHLKELVRRDLEKIMADQVEAKLEQELFDEILKLAEIEVADILVDDELNRIILRITQNLKQQDKKLDDHLKEENTTLDALKARLRPQAEKNVKTTLIIDEIGKSEKVQVAQEEIENASKGVDQSKLSDQQKTDLKNYLAVSILQSKTLDLVKKSVTA